VTLSVRTVIGSELTAVCGDAVDGRDPFLYDIELLRAKERLLEQFELFPERKYPPMPVKPSTRLVVIVNGERVDSTLFQPHTPEDVGKQAQYVAQSLAEGYTFNKQGGRSRKRRTK